MPTSQQQRSILRAICPKLVHDRRVSCSDLLARHRHEAQLVTQAGREGMEKVAPYLLGRATDARTLSIAWQDLITRGGQVPGSDGRHYAELDDRQQWEQCRALSDALRASDYVPGPVRRVPLPPVTGRSAMPFQNFLDRVAQRAAESIIRPLLVPRFDDRAFGAKAERGRLRALALAGRLSVQENRNLWMTGCIEGAYQNAPQEVILRLARKRLAADDLVELIERLLRPRSAGLLETNPLSELLLNLLLHRFLDVPWRDRQPELPLLRTTQHLMVLCRSIGEAKRARRVVRELLEPLGMHLSVYTGTGIQALGPDRPAEWWDVAVDRRLDYIRFRLTERAWERLALALSLAREGPEPERQAVRAIRDWIVQMGPCSIFTPSRPCQRRIKKLTRELGLKFRLPVVRWLMLDASSHWMSLEKAC